MITQRNIIIATKTDGRFSYVLRAVLKPDGSRFPHMTSDRDKAQKFDSIPEADRHIKRFSFDGRTYISVPLMNASLRQQAIARLRKTPGFLGYCLGFVIIIIMAAIEHSIRFIIFLNRSK